jgi:hypothetical protein
MFVLGCAVYVGTLIQRAMRTWQGDRTAELLVKYHDMLINVAKAAHELPSPAPKEQGGAGGKPNGGASK